MSRELWEYKENVTAAESAGKKVFGRPPDGGDTPEGPWKLSSGLGKWREGGECYRQRTASVRETEVYNGTVYLGHSMKFKISQS